MKTTPTAISSIAKRNTNTTRRYCHCSTSSATMMLRGGILNYVVILLLLVLPPFAHPFATASSNHYQQHQQLQQQHHNQYDDKRYITASTTRTVIPTTVRRNTALYPNKKDDNSKEGRTGRISRRIRSVVETVQSVLPLSRRRKQRQRQQQLLVSNGGYIDTTLNSNSKNDVRSNNDNNKLNHFHYGTNNDNSYWKGEEDVSIVSKLLYQYATPLIKTASNKIRPLEINDSLPIVQYRKMNIIVPTLQKIYQHQKDTTGVTQRKQQQLSTPSSSSAVTSPPSTSWILTKSLLLHQKNMLLKTGILRLFNTAIQAFPALLVSRLLRLIEQQQKIGTAMSGGNTIRDAIQASILLVVVLSIKMILENQYFHNLINMSTQVRGSLAGLLFDKSLQLRNGGVGSSTSTISTKTIVPTKVQDASGGGNRTISAAATTNNNNDNSNYNELGVGGVLNLMQSDTSIIENAALQIHTSWDGPLQIMLYTALLYKYLGNSVFYGIAVLLITIPLNSITLRLLNKLSIIENKTRDQRTKYTSESIKNIKLLKLLSWEYLFVNTISYYRSKELRMFILRGFVRAINMAISNAVPAIVLVVTLTAYVRTGRPFVASTIFTAISLFNQLRFPLFFYPMFIDSMANGYNAMKRITTYLQNTNDEIVQYVQVLPPIQLIPSTLKQQHQKQAALALTTDDPNNGSPWCYTGGSIEMQNGNFLWSANPATVSSTSLITTAAGQMTSTAAPPSSSTIKTIQEPDNGGIVNGMSAIAPPISTSSSTMSSTDSNTSTNMALVNVELKVNPGEVVAVIGSVGSGKSALIKGLLGELKPIDDGSDTNNNGRIPTVVRYGDVAYCSQEAWLPKGSIRDAVLFGREYNEQRYREAIYNSGLDEDIVDDGDVDLPSSSAASTTQNKSPMQLNKKPSGGSGALTHDTDVGEGGSSLSGGQRQRVAIARALYSASPADEPKVYLLDDCLAALDAHVGSIVFDRLLNKFKQSNAAVVLVTNDPNLPRRCDRVLLMGKYQSMTGDNNNFDNSKSAGSSIIHQGTYDELLESGYDLRSYTAHQGNDEESASSADIDDFDVVSSNVLDGTNSMIQNNTGSHSNDLNNDNLSTNIEGDDARIRQQHSVEALSVDPALEYDTNEKSNIFVFGGATDTTEADVCFDVGCHADVEGQATMQNCPDYYAHQPESLSAPSTSTTATIGSFDEEDFIEYFNEEDFVNSTVAMPLVEGSNATMWTPPLPALGDHARRDEALMIPPELGQHAAITAAPPAGKKLLSADDSMSSGAIPWSVYLSYFKAVGSPILVVAMLSAYLLSNGAQFFQQYTVAKWTEVGASSALVGAKYMSSLIKAAVVVSLSLWVRSFLTMIVGVRASESFHSKMLRSVFAAPMSFFDTTPSGQLLSRFGKEIETVDRSVPDSIASVLFCFLQIILSMGALAGVVTPGMLIPLSLVSVLYVKAMSEFRPAARGMKRVETKTRSPIYTHFGEALRGAETIRSIRGAVANWSNQHRTLTDTNLRAFYTVKAFDRWLSTRLETLGNTVVFATAVASIVLTRSGALTAGSAGWGLTQALAITGLMTWAVRCLTDLESNMLSVMRVKELTSGGHAIESKVVDLKPLKDDGKTIKTKRNKPRMPRELSKAGEALEPLLTSPTRTTLVPIDNSRSLVLDGWPWRGQIEFKNVSMRYTPTSPLVLKNVNLSIPAGTTLGVVGRTGSGKSSLLTTLFRLVEIENNPGVDSARSSIEVDGVDIRSVSMGSLRQSLAIIPQDPVLFTGTLAYNLDATGQSTRHEMIAALEAASPTMAEQFLRSPGADGLDTMVTEGGKNLSLGQRQLICLARALLRKSKILVLDEATSSVDARTDQEVQETIRREFVNKGVTVITVAHRLDTVLGYDKIAVLGNGEVLEYGKPNDLIAIPGGELRRLVMADRRNKQKGSSKKASMLTKNETRAVITAVSG